MARCKWEIGEYRCPHRALEGEEHCIFHLPNLRKQKDSDLYRRFHSSLKALFLLRDYAWSGFCSPGDVAFREKVFGGDLDLSRAEIQGNADFVGAKIQGDANFLLTKIQGYANFGVAEIQGDANFAGSEIKGDANFERAKIQRNAYFGSAEIQVDANFWEVEIQKDANFERAKIQGDTYFVLAKIQGDTNFREAEIWQLADFSGAGFGGSCRFDGVRGRRAALVGGLEREGRGQGTTRTTAGTGRRGYHLRLYEPGPPRLVCEGTKFGAAASFQKMDLSRARFQQVDLSNVSFLHSQIHQTRFIACTWGRGPESWRLRGRRRPWWRWRRPRLLYDELQWRENCHKNREQERIAKEPGWLSCFYRAWCFLQSHSFWPWAMIPEEDSISASDIEVLALQLKQSLETARDPITAGDFHFAAMEMKLAQARQEGRWLRAGGLWLYKIMSGYGERPGRAAWWLAALAGGLTAGIFLGDIPLPHDPPAWTGSRFEEAFFHVLSHMLPFKLGSLSSQHQSLTGILRWITLGETMAGTTLFTIFVLALRRRFKR